MKPVTEEDYSKDSDAVLDSLQARRQLLVARHVRPGHIINNLQSGTPLTQRVVWRQVLEVVLFSCLRLGLSALSSLRQSRQSSASLSWPRRLVDGSVQHLQVSGHSGDIICILLDGWDEGVIGCRESPRCMLLRSQIFLGYPSCQAHQ